MNDTWVPVVTCAQDGCEASFKEHRWGMTKAHGAGWFIGRDGVAWCPDHLPDWVPAWRERRAGRE